MTARGITGPIVALTGTPGTGKTTVAKLLRTRGYAVLDLARYANDERFAHGPDPEHHDAILIDEDALGHHLHEHLATEIGTELEAKLETEPGPHPTPTAGNDPVFIESHFAHELPCVDRILILRLHPKILEARLQERDWPPEKIRENLEAEGMDLILQEALERRDDERKHDAHAKDERHDETPGKDESEQGPASDEGHDPKPFVEPNATAMTNQPALPPLAIGEIDTTGRTPEEVCDAVVHAAKTTSTNLEIGKVDWSGEVLGWY